ncbi:MAG TPA: YnfA family protein [Kouleothrix sp.]|uniref:YnfA family protein n=1 Tax=Kouleothrix sp. TaxID=2779161 RepID=UPI002D06976B|nr:YnfA family protein [Kouleothrix sp.]HRC77406.1 YnfA family protein [Kouleothrix sp.]
MLAGVKAVGLFAIAAVCELGGAYLVWQWRHAGRPAPFVLAGVVALLLYSLVQTAQVFSFGRAFAAYGAVFILGATLWGWAVDGTAPDRWDWLGAGICLVGAAVMLWMPRPAG